MHDDLSLLQRGQSVRRQRAAQRRGVVLKAAGAVALVSALLISVAGLISSRVVEQKRLHRRQAQAFLTRDGVT